MGTVRFFNGGRDGGKRSVAGDMMRLEIQKKGKLPAADRYKRMLKQRMAESRSQALSKVSRGFSLPGTIKEARTMSARAEKALKEIAAKKAAKEAKAQRRMVIVTPRYYNNGRLTRDGKIYDKAGNMVARINTKNGKMATTGGWALGQYKPKSFMTDKAIQEAIDKYSPYFINMRKMQALQQGGVVTAGAAMYGPASAADDSVTTTVRPKLGGNTWGTQAENVWGTQSDNVWGTSSSDVWGNGGGSGTVWDGSAQAFFEKAAHFVLGLFGF